VCRPLTFAVAGSRAVHNLNPVKKAQSTTCWPLYATSAKPARRRYRSSEQVLELKRQLTPPWTPSPERSIDWCCWLHGPTGHQKRSKVASCSSSRETTQTRKDCGYPGFVRTTRKLRARKAAYSRWLSTRSVSVRDKIARPVAARNPALPYAALSRARLLQEENSAVLLMA
jgi:hypothetical protein